MIWLLNLWRRVGRPCNPHNNTIKTARYLTQRHGGRLKILPLKFVSTCSTNELNDICPVSRTQYALGYGNKKLMKSKTALFYGAQLSHHLRTITQNRYLNTGNQKSDINQNWVTRFPKSVQPYLVLSRMDRPIGYWLLFLPGAWSISLAAEAGSMPNIHLLSLFFAGAVMMRGAGCVINDMWDFNLDKKVARTSTRPIASGDITHFQALVFLASQLSISLAILLSLNQYSIILGASSLLFVVSYPLMKRITFWPQFVLGLTFNWGCLLGWSAVSGSLDLAVCLPLYVAAVNWTILYDTIYAFQDVEDDRLVGVKSTALLFGDQAKTCLTGFAAVVIANLIAVGINTSQTWPYYLGLMAVTSHLAWQVTTVDLSEPKDCLWKFKSNKWLGILLWMSIMLGTFGKSDEDKMENVRNSEKTISNV